MDLMQCLHIVLPALGVPALLVLGPVGRNIAKYGLKPGLKVTGAYLVNIPTRIAGFVLIAYRSFVTKVVALATALGGTIQAVITASSEKGRWVDVASTFLEEVYRETLSSTGLMAKGFQELTSFLTQPGVCSQLLNLEKIGFGIFYIWRGVAIIIVVLWIVSKYREWRNLPFDMDFKALTIGFLFTFTALVNLISSGDSTTGLVELVNNGAEFLNALSEAVNSGPPQNNATENLSEGFSKSFNKTR